MSSYPPLFIIIDYFLYFKSIVSKKQGVLAFSTGATEVQAKEQKKCFHLKKQLYLKYVCNIIDT